MKTREMSTRTDSVNLVKFMRNDEYRIRYYRCYRGVSCAVTCEACLLFCLHLEILLWGGIKLIR